MYEVISLPFLTCNAYTHSPSQSSAEAIRLVPLSIYKLTQIHPPTAASLSHSIARVFNSSVEKIHILFSMLEHSYWTMLGILRQFMVNKIYYYFAVHLNLLKTSMCRHKIQMCITHKVAQSDKWGQQRGTHEHSLSLCLMCLHHVSGHLNLSRGREVSFCV